jgi:hypothetical protein
MTVYFKEEDIINLESDDEETEEAPVPLQVAKESAAIPKSESQDQIVRIPDEKIPDILKFRPGYKVVCLDFGEDSFPMVTYGTVQYAGVDLGSGSMEFMYRIQPHSADESFYTKEATLQFAQETAVWAKISSEYKEAIVFSSSQAQSDQQPVYSVSDVASYRLHTDVPSRLVRYRAAGSIKPVDIEGIALPEANSNNRQEPEQVEDPIPRNIVAQQVSLVDQQVADLRPGNNEDISLQNEIRQQAEDSQSDGFHRKEPRRSEERWEPPAKRCKEGSPSVATEIQTRIIRIPRSANYNGLAKGK